MGRREETLGTNTTTGTDTGFDGTIAPGFGPTGTIAGSATHGSGYGAAGSAPGYGAGHHAATGGQGTGYGPTGNGAGVGTSTGLGHQAGYGPTGNGTGFGHQGEGGVATTGYGGVGTEYATGATGTASGGGGRLLAKAKEKLAGHKH